MLRLSRRSAAERLVRQSTSSALPLFNNNVSRTVGIIAAQQQAATVRSYARSIQRNVIRKPVEGFTSNVARVKTMVCVDPCSHFLASSLVRSIGHQTDKEEKDKDPHLDSLEKKSFSDFFGFRNMIRDWKPIFSAKHLQSDFTAGFTVTMVAMPLNLAIAVGSGVPAELGLVTGVIAGTIGALFGGSKLGVSGPAAAMAMLVTNVVRDYGLAGLAVTTLMCGGLQLLTGFFKAGGVIKFIPSPLITGFMGGIGALIISRQLTTGLGITPELTEGRGLLELMADPRFLDMIQGSSVCLTGLTLATALGINKLYPRAPGIMIAVAASSMLQAVMQFPGVEVVGDLPSFLPSPEMPQLPSASDMGGIFMSSLLFYGLASLESLLSAAALDKLANAKKPYDCNKELVGQGLANLASSFFGGLPATSVIARSSLSVLAGAKTRRAALVHAGMLLAAVYLLSPIFSHIPLPTLAGVLIKAGLRMLDPQELKHLISVSPVEVIPATLTFATIVSGDLIAGVALGLGSSLALNYMRPEGRMPMKWSLSSAPFIEGTRQSHCVSVALEGPVNFLSSLKIEKLYSAIQATCNQHLPTQSRHQIEQQLEEDDEEEEEQQQTIVNKMKKKRTTGLHIRIDLTKTGLIDATGSELFAKMVHELEKSGHEVTIHNAAPQCRTILLKNHVPEALLLTNPSSVRS